MILECRLSDRQQAINTLQFFRNETIDDNQLYLIKLCLKSGVIEAQKIFQSLPLFVSNKDTQSIVEALKNNSFEKVQQWVDCHYDVSSVHHLIIDSPSISAKHLANDNPKGKEVVSNRYSKENRYDRQTLPAYLLSGFYSRI